MSPSVNWNVFFFSRLLARTTATCWAATDSTGSSMRLNSSKQPHEPDWAKPVEFGGTQTTRLPIFELLGVWRPEEKNYGFSEDIPL